MKIINIKKRSGGSRTIYAPNSEEMAMYRQILKEINVPALPQAHGFMPMKGIITNAEVHVGKDVVMSMDLKDFFDSVKPSMVRGKVPTVVLHNCFLDTNGNIGTTDDCRARQGLPTSPMIANIAAKTMDDAIIKRFKKLGLSVDYTRYADDLTFSLNGADDATIETIKKEVKAIVARCGFSLNPKKTRVQFAKSGRQEVCGLMVDKDGIHISRRQRRKLRSANHNLLKAVELGAPQDELITLNNKQKGLLEFSRLKMPGNTPLFTKMRRSQMKDAKKLAKAFGILPPADVKKKIEDKNLGNGVFITGDPAMMYGMSLFGNNWTSCMNIQKSKYKYKKGVAIWQRMEGVSIAYLATDKTLTKAGVTRPAMWARCLLYALEDGRIVRGDIYCSAGHGKHPLNDHARRLDETLQKEGIVLADQQGTVVGRVDRYLLDSRYWPYLDLGAWIIDGDKIGLRFKKK